MVDINKITINTDTNTLKKKQSDGQLDAKKKEVIQGIEQEFQQRFDEITRLFNENDSRRRRREIPDYLCGIFMLIFQLVKD